MTNKSIRAAIGAAISAAVISKELSSNLSAGLSNQDSIPDRPGGMLVFRCRYVGVVLAAADKRGLSRSEEQSGVSKRR